MPSIQTQTIKHQFMQSIIVCFAMTSFAFAQNDSQDEGSISEQNIISETDDMTVLNQEGFDKQLLEAYEGNPESQFKLALFFTKQTPDYKKAAYWYKQAARQGMPNAQYNLGHFYLQGLGVEQDTAKTISWWEQAAHQDYTPAQHNIGTAYFEGIGVEQNIQLAQQWFQRCAKLGSDACAESLTVVNENMSGLNAQSTSEQAAETDPGTQSSEQNSVNNDDPQETLTEEKTEVSDEIALEINAYLNNDLESPLLATLSSEGDYEVIDSSEQWLKIKINQPIEVWCYKSFVRIENQLGILTGDKVRARTAPSTTESEIITELAIDTELEVIEQTDKWVKLALPNIVAWSPKLPEEDDAEIISSPDSQITENETSEVALENDLEVDEESVPQSNEALSTTIADPRQYTYDYQFIDRRSDDEWLFTADPNQYTIVLGNFESITSLNEFAMKKQLFDNDSTHFLIAKRQKIEWKYILFGNFDDTQSALDTANEHGFSHAYLVRIGNIQEQRCSAWKTTIPSPKKLDEYCLKKTALQS